MLLPVCTQQEPRVRGINKSPLLPKTPWFLPPFIESISMYEYTVYDPTGTRIDTGESAFRDLPKVLDHYGEKNFTIVVKKSIDQKEFRK